MNKQIKTVNIPQRSNVVLNKWMIWEINTKSDPLNPVFTQHLVGVNEKTNEARVSSRIVEFDPSTMRVKTSSGKVYRVTGLPEENPDCNLVWNQWQDGHRVRQALMVSAEYLVAMHKAHREKSRSTVHAV